MRQCEVFCPSGALTLAGGSENEKSRESVIVKGTVSPIYQRLILKPIYTNSKEYMYVSPS